MDYKEAQWLYDMGMHDTLVLCNPTWFITCKLSEPSETYFRNIHGRLKSNGDVYESTPKRNI